MRDPFVVALLLLLPCLYGQTAPRDSLTIGTSVEFENFHPLIATESVSLYMLFLGWRRLVVLDPQMKWIPMLVKEAPSFSNKLVKKEAAGLRVSFDILDGANWGDGEPVTCQDVELSWKISTCNNVSIQKRDAFLNISSIQWDKAKPKHCSLHLKEAQFNFLANLPDPVPAHLEQQIFEKSKNEPEAYDRNSHYTKDPSNPGLYDGPYRVSEVKLGSHVSFVQNELSMWKKNNIKKILFKLIPSSNTLMASLETGAIDMVAPNAGLSIDQAVAFEKKIQAQKLPLKAVYVDAWTYGHIDMNLTNPILADLKVRQALAMGVNKKEMVDTLFAGKARPTDSLVAFQDPWYTDDFVREKYDPKKAAQILESAGWKIAANGIREKNGKPLSLTLLGPAGGGLTDLLQGYLKDQYKRIGVEILLKNQPGRVMFGETLPHRDFDLAIYSWTTYPEYSPRSMLYSQAIPKAANAWSGSNYLGYNNPEMDHLIDKLELELDFAKRKKIAAKIQSLYASDLPALPLYFRQIPNVIPINLEGYQMVGHLYYETFYAENWSLK